ncbi:phosphoribosyltransferase [Candidatus Micrarchaeota archaeon]|nr:phosphoribosyltransferase [Candidatus Micrarchaeota archaeon]
MEILQLSWSNAVKSCEKLAAKIDFEPDIVVGLSRGGLIPARILGDCLSLRHVFVLGISLYSGIGKKKTKPEIIQDLATFLVKGNKILLVDDVADSGTSLFTAKKYLLKKGAKSVRIATIHYKSGSLVKPDYFVSRTKAWIVYPWEAKEFGRLQ